MVGSPKGHKAALGFRTHSGWACAILAAGQGKHIEIIDRRCVVLYDSKKSGAKQPFHTVESMPFAKAKRYISICRDTTNALAREAIDALLAITEHQGLPLSGVCVIAASSRALPDLAAILASHALIHTAEGEFYRDALVGAAEAMGISTARLKAAQALSHVAMQMDMSEAAMTKALTEMGKTVGRPWTSDEKLATLAAWSLLAG